MGQNLDKFGNSFVGFTTLHDRFKMWPVPLGQVLCGLTHGLNLPCTSFSATQGNSSLKRFMGISRGWGLPYSQVVELDVFAASHLEKMRWFGSPKPKKASSLYQPGCLWNRYFSWHLRSTSRFFSVHPLDAFQETGSDVGFSCCFPLGHPFISDEKGWMFHHLQLNSCSQVN